jgi:outer membrane protein assembly factor BamE
MRILLIALAISWLSACSFVGFPGVYKIDVEQGNIVDQDMADQLKPGMSRRQVRFILGTPLVEDTFNQDRWDYLYVLRNGPDVLDEARISVVFEGDTLVTVSGDYLPPAWDGASDSDTPQAEFESESAEMDAAGENNPAGQDDI